MREFHYYYPQTGTTSNTLPLYTPPPPFPSSTTLPSTSLIDDDGDNNNRNADRISPNLSPTGSDHSRTATLDVSGITPSGSQVLSISSLSPQIGGSIYPTGSGFGSGVSSPVSTIGSDERGDDSFENERPSFLSSFGINNNDSSFDTSPPGSIRTSRSVPIRASANAGIISLNSTDSSPSSVRSMPAGRTQPSVTPSLIYSHSGQQASSIPQSPINHRRHPSGVPLSGTAHSASSSGIHHRRTRNLSRQEEATLVPASDYVLHPFLRKWDVGHYPIELAQLARVGKIVNYRFPSSQVTKSYHGMRSGSESPLSTSSDLFHVGSSSIASPKASTALGHSKTPSTIIPLSLLNQEAANPPQPSILLHLSPHPYVFEVVPNEHVKSVSIGDVLDGIAWIIQGAMFEEMNLKQTNYSARRPSHSHPHPHSHSQSHSQSQFDGRLFRGLTTVSNPVESSSPRNTSRGRSRTSAESAASGSSSSSQVPISGTPVSMSSTVASVPVRPDTMWTLKSF